MTTMSKKTLNKANLERLGAPKLAERVQRSVAFYTPKRTRGPRRKFAIAEVVPENRTVS